MNACLLVTIVAALLSPDPPGPPNKRVVIPPTSTAPLQSQPEGEALKSAEELNIMRGWPIEPTFRALRERTLVAPYNRWTFVHVEDVLPTAVIRRGDRPAAPLPAGPAFDVDAVTFTTSDGASTRVADFFAATGLDGLMILHHGKVVAERYANGMSHDQPHLFLGATAGFAGLLVQALVSEGKVPPEMRVVDLVKHFEYTTWRDVSARNIYDMTVALDLPETWKSEYLTACGLGASRGGGVLEFLRSFKEEVTGEAQGFAFHYLPPEAEVLAEIVRCKERMSLSHAIEARIWSKLSAEHDARIVVDPDGTEVVGLGLVATVPDVARFGQMLLQRGSFNGHEVIANVVALDVLAGGDPAPLAKNETASKFLPGGAFHAQWWNMPRADGAVFALGDYGQTIWINPKTDVVIVRVSSHSHASSDFLRLNEIKAMIALAKAVAESN